MKYEPAETWDAALEKAGETLRPDATDGTKQRVQTLARTYEVNSAARRLNLKRGTIEESLILELLPSFVDPEGAVRIPAEAVETIATDKQAHERLAAYEIVSSGDVATVADMNMKTIKRKLKRIGADSRRPEWGEVRGLWGLPHYFTDFKEQLKIKEREYRESVQAEQAEKAARKAD
ncbi:MAG: hypothetical protein AAFR56_13630, partial [Chloroflexota bacterium]